MTDLYGLFRRHEDTGAKVERAARLLDEKRPGWSALVDLDHFSLASPCQCVLGQVYRERRWPMRWFTFDDGYIRGLCDLDVDRPELRGVFEVDDLYREHWITAILSRRAAAAVPTNERQQEAVAAGDPVEPLCEVGR